MQPLFQMSQPTIETTTSSGARICYIRLMNTADKLAITYFLNEPISKVHQDPEKKWCEIYIR